MPRVGARIGNRTDKILLDGSDGSSSNAGSSILCEDGTITVYGKGNRIFAETATTQGGDHELAFIPNFKYVVQSQARAR